MRKPIYANTEHEVIVSGYILMVKEFVKDLSNETRYNNFLEVLDKTTKETGEGDLFLIYLFIHLILFICISC